MRRQIRHETAREGGRRRFTTWAPVAPHPLVCSCVFTVSRLDLCCFACASSRLLCSPSPFCSASCLLSPSSPLLALQLAHSKYGQALEALVDLTPENRDKRIMVPLTSSMYIPGTLSQVDSVLVDVGTGYFVSKPIADARVFIQSKMEMISGNLAKVAGAMSGKRRDLDAVSSILQAKLQAQYQAQQNAMQKVESLQ